jgi:hypothetical protein
VDWPDGKQRRARLASPICADDGWCR